MCPRAFLIVHIKKEHMAQVPLAKDDDMVRHSRRIEPISRSVWPFCYGDGGCSWPVANAVASENSVHLTRDQRARPIVRRKMRSIWPSEGCAVNEGQADARSGRESQCQ